MSRYTLENGHNGLCEAGDITDIGSIMVKSQRENFPSFTGLLLALKNTLRVLTFLFYH